MLGDLFAYGDAGDAQLVAASVIALDQNADRVTAIFRIENARGGADASFKFVADHASAAADVAFFDRAAMRGVERVESILGFHVESVDVVQPAVPGFGHHGERPPVAFHVGRAVLDFPGDDGVAHHADAVRVGDHDGAVEKAGVFEPGCAGHLAVAVEREPAAEDGVVGVLPRGRIGSDTGADRTFADLQFALPEMSVVWPTSTPLTSVMALYWPGVPSKGTPRSRARGLAGRRQEAEREDKSGSQRDMASEARHKGATRACFVGVNRERGVVVQFDCHPEQAVD